MVIERSFKGFESMKEKRRITVNHKSAIIYKCKGIQTGYINWKCGMKFSNSYSIRSNMITVTYIFIRCVSISLSFLIITMNFTTIARTYDQLQLIMCTCNLCPEDFRFDQTLIHDTWMFETAQVHSTTNRGRINRLFRVSISVEHDCPTIEKVEVVPIDVQRATNWINCVSSFQWTRSLIPW